MPLIFWMSAMSVAEFALWATLGIVFWSKGLHKRFPALNKYLALRVCSMPILLGLELISLHSTFKPELFYPLYFYSYWLVYIASAVLLFFVCFEIFRSALAGYTGLMRLGTVIFRWIALVSAVASLATVSYSHINALLLPDLAYPLMRSVSILELGLLTFLCLSMNVLGLSPRDLTFGSALGLGFISTNDFIHSLLTSKTAGLSAPVQIAYEAIILVSIGIWVAYFALPEPAPKPVVLPAKSTIYRWNEIAAALGHGTKIAVQQPANGFFLTDVERVVEKVLTRNLQGNESKT